MPRGSANDLIYQAKFEKKFRAELDANGNYLYVGYAMPGTSESDPKWQIRKITYDATYTNTPIAVDWANGNDNFDKVWNNRASYSYY